VTGALIPLWLKVAYTAFVVVLVGVYWTKAAAGPRNFLWFSDIALFGTALALWLESALFASAMAVGVLLPETLWTISVLTGLITGRPIRGVGDYMFDPHEPWYMKALSLFHVHMLVTLIWIIATLGYDGRALLLQTVLAWIVFPLTYAVTEPRFNINRVFGPGPAPQRRLHPIAYLALQMAAVPVLIYLPTHLLLNALFGR
jgi:hypothetical protein